MSEGTWRVVEGKTETLQEGLSYMGAIRQAVAWAKANHGKVYFVKDGVYNLDVTRVAWDRQEERVVRTVQIPVG